MSYNVAICLPPVPSDDQTAWAELDSMIESKGITPPQFQELHDRLTARYPCICSLPDEAVDDGVWSDGPLANDFGHRAAVLGLVFSRVDEVLPFPIETANAQDMIVFDWQTRTIHRPSEERANVPEPQGKPWWRFW